MCFLCSFFHCDEFCWLLNFHLTLVYFPKNEISLLYYFAGDKTGLLLYMERKYIMRNM